MNVKNTVLKKPDFLDYIRHKCIYIKFYKVQTSLQFCTWEKNCWEEEKDYKEQEEPFGAMDTYTILIMVTVSQMYTNVKKNTK